MSAMVRPASKHIHHFLVGSCECLLNVVLSTDSGPTDCRQLSHCHDRLTSQEYESEFRATGLVQRSTGKEEVAKRSPHVVVKRAPKFAFLPRVQKTRVVVTERRPFAPSKKKSNKGKTIHVFFAVITFFA